MSTYVALDTLSEEQIKQLGAPVFAGDKAFLLTQRTVDNRHMCVPMYRLYQVLGVRPNGHIQYPTTRVEFTGELRPHQLEIRDHVLEILQKQSVCNLRLHCGAGKTILAIHLACQLGVKVLCLVHRTCLIKQWTDSICEFTNLQKKDVQLIKANEPIKDVPFSIINVTNLGKRSSVEMLQFGTIICDECHTTVGSDKNSQVFPILTPKYCMGLSATPERPDMMHKVTECYLGDVYVVKEMHQPHLVYKVPYSPDTDYGSDTFKVESTGKLNWNAILNASAMDEARNQMIASIPVRFADRHFIVLSKRVEQAYRLKELLVAEGVHCTIYTGTDKSFDENARVLITTYSKGGVGLDWPKLDALIVATDVSNLFEQYAGRIFRKKGMIPLIFDVVDSFGPFFIHFKKRKEFYEKTGGVVWTYQPERPVPSHEQLLRMVS